MLQKNKGDEQKAAGKTEKIMLCSKCLPLNYALFGFS